MSQRRLLPVLILPLLLLFHLAVAQDPPADTTVTQTDSLEQAAQDSLARLDSLREAGKRAEAKARAEARRKREEEQKSIADTVTMKMPKLLSDRGEYNGWNRDTGGAIILARAGELREIREQGTEVVYLERNVKIFQDSLTMWCDWSRLHRATNVLELYGNVVMIDPQRKLRADEVFYYERQQRSIARNNVIIEKDSVVLTCREAEFDELEDIAEFEQQVTMRDLRRDVVLTSEKGTYNIEREFARAPVEPVLVRLDSLNQEEARIVSRYMEYDAQQGRAFARDDVNIRWHEVTGTSQELYYYPDESRALLVGEPNVLHDRDEVVGDSIWMYMNEETIDSAVVVGDAIAYTVSDSTGFGPRSTLRGRRIVLTFTEGEVSQMASYGQATGVYHVFEEGVDQGSNKVTGDEVFLNIEGGELASVRVVGGAEGTFFPPRLARDLRDE